MLAETFEPAMDGLQFAFMLKEGMQFHGGYGELTAEDVKFTFERTRADEAGDLVAVLGRLGGASRRCRSTARTRGRSCSTSRSLR